MKIVQEELKLADEILEDAALLLKQRRSRSAINRIYYAMFHGACALLTSLGIICKSHAGVMNRFGEDVIKKKLMDKGYAKYLNQAYNLREKSDYQIIIEINEREIRILYQNATDFLKEIRRILQKSN